MACSPALWLLAVAACSNDNHRGGAVCRLGHICKQAAGHDGKLAAQRAVQHPLQARVCPLVMPAQGQGCAGQWWVDEGPACAGTRWLPSGNSHTHSCGAPHKHLVPRPRPHLTPPPPHPTPAACAPHYVGQAAAAGAVVAGEHPPAGTRHLHAIQADSTVLGAAEIGIAGRSRPHCAAGASEGGRRSGVVQQMHLSVPGAGGCTMVKTGPGSWEECGVRWSNGWAAPVNDWLWVFCLGEDDTRSLEVASSVH